MLKGKVNSTKPYLLNNNNNLTNSIKKKRLFAGGNIWHERTDFKNNGCKVLMTISAPT